jgi:hypothetical protein
VVHCLDLKTGKQHFAERIEGPGWASPVAAGGHVYFFGKNGVTTVLKASPAFEVVATNRLWKADDSSAADGAQTSKGRDSYDSIDPIVYGVAAVDGQLFVRTGTELYCIRK